MLLPQTRKNNFEENTGREFFLWVTSTLVPISFSFSSNRFGFVCVSVGLWIGLSSTFWSSAVWDSTPTVSLSIMNNFKRFIFGIGRHLTKHKSFVVPSSPTPFLRKIWKKLPKPLGIVDKLRSRLRGGSPPRSLWTIPYMKTKNCFSQRDAFARELCLGGQKVMTQHHWRVQPYWRTPFRP